MKRRSLTLVVCLLATLSLASVGFAAWVISAGDTEQLTGTIKVETVTDEKLEIRNIQLDSTNYADATDVQFVFGKPADVVTTYKWLKNETVDKLSIKVSFEVFELVTGKEAVELKDQTKINIAATFEATKLAVEGQEGKYYAKVADETPEVTFNSVTDKFEFTIELKWGNFFGADETNPFKLYNDQPYSEALANQARENLTQMFTAMSGAAYTVGIDAQYKN